MKSFKSEWIFDVPNNYSFEKAKNHPISPPPHSDDLILPPPHSVKKRSRLSEWMETFRNIETSIGGDEISSYLSPTSISSHSQPPLSDVVKDGDEVWIPPFTHIGDPISETIYLDDEDAVIAAVRSKKGFKVSLPIGLHRNMSCWETDYGAEGWLSKFGCYSMMESRKTRGGELE